MIDGIPNRPLYFYQKDIIDSIVIALLLLHIVTAILIAMTTIFIAVDFCHYCSIITGIGSINLPPVPPITPPTTT